jgi:hypothetical protein
MNQPQIPQQPLPPPPIRWAEQLYALLLQLYPRSFRQQFAAEMKFVFAESLRDAYAQEGGKGIFVLLVWTFVDFFISLFREHLEERRVHHAMNAIQEPVVNPGVNPTAVTLQRWGGFTSFVLAVVFIIPEAIYLTGKLEEANGPLTYALADFLYGPVKAVCLVVTVYALRERIGERAPRLMSLATLTAILAAAMFVAAALFRSTNRQYHLAHPELHLEMSSTVLAVWGTLVGGVIATACHFLGWSLLLIGAAGWISARLPRALCMLYWLVGVISLLAYLWRDGDLNMVMLASLLCIWQGIMLLRVEPAATPPPQVSANHPELA